MRNTRSDAVSIKFSGSLTYHSNYDDLKTFNGTVYKNTGNNSTNSGLSWSDVYPEATDDEWDSISGVASNNSASRHQTSAQTTLFTGHHVSYIENLTTLDDIEKNTGLIVCANKNDYYSPSKQFDRGGIDNIDLNESLPVTTLASKPNDKSCFGVISPNNRENIDNIKRLCQVNSLGEGAIWVSNKNGSLESGDYITTSSLPGYGQKQDDDILHNYTVAKITRDCDFTQREEPKIMVQYDNSDNMLYDDEDQIVWGENTDASGNVITQLPYKIRHLDPSGNIITEEEYNTKIAASEEAYIAGFVGCTYHCG